MVATMRPKGTVFETGLRRLVGMLPQDCLVIEVGSYAGESTEIFLERARHVICVDRWEPYDEITAEGLKPLDAAEAEAAFDAMAAKHLGRISKIKKHSAAAVLTYCNDLLATKADAVYLDARHDENSVMYDIALWLPYVAKGGFICGHDYGMGFHVGVKKAVDEIFCKPDMVFEDTSWLVKKE